jgi:hypothetical protein
MNDVEDRQKRAVARAQKKDGSGDDDDDDKSLEKKPKKDESDDSKPEPIRGFEDDSESDAKE